MEDEEDLFVSQCALSASEDEEDDVDSKRKHQKLLEAISSLDGKKRRRLAERTEASLQVSEFGISSEGAGEKISLSDLIEPIKKASSLSTVKKQLNKLKDQKSVELPLTNEETQKIQRAISYKNASQEVAKWDHIVKQNRRAEQLVFPLTDETLKPTPIEDKISGWKPYTPLEMEIFNILRKNKQPITDPLLTPLEEASLKAMSLEEAKLRRAELQKARALQSYYEAKARRERKIKSKKYHKLLKKGKQREAIKEFEDLRKTNPEAALEELEKLERARMEERMSLKHQNSGKWAKSKAIMAKYDDEARKAMQEQLQRNKDLTQKIEVLSESEESEKEEVVPDFVNDAQVTSEGANPWMTGKLHNDAKDSESQEEEEKTQAEMESNTKDEEEEEEEQPESEEESLLREFEDKRRLRKQGGEQEPHESDPSNNQEPTADMAQEAEEKAVSQFNALFQKLVEENRKEEQTKQSSAAVLQEALEGDLEEDEVEHEEEGPILMESLERIQTLESVDALGQEEEVEELPSRQKEPRKRKLAKQTLVKPTDDQQAKKSNLIDHNDVLPVKAKKVRMPMLPTTVEEEEEEAEDDEAAQKMIIQEAFAGDDVISDFLKEKRKAEMEGKPQDINLVLPGWGEWGGTNLKVSRKKRKRFIIKAPPAPPRKDQRLPNVIINEKRNIMAASHQVNELPFPFTNRKHFESSIRAPVGKTWNTEKAFHKLTSPRVITKQGHIIEPITEDVFQKHAKAQKPGVEPHKPKQKPKGFRKRKSRAPKP